MATVKLRKGGQRQWSATLALAAAILSGAGCSAGNSRPLNSPAPPSIQQLQYYPYQVKGYQDSYPARKILILMPIDNHHAPPNPAISPAMYDGNVPIGSSEGPGGQIAFELYCQPLGPIVQNALKESAREAGLIPSISPETAYVGGKDLNVDYVMQTRIVQFWVTKKNGPGGDAGPAWFTEADVALDVTIYKPPFTVPFWQGSGTATYEDPPIDNPNASPEDETAIYDQPGEVLSVAMTRAVAAIFSRTDLHALVIGDRMTVRQH
jgi:hypothetical protein